MPIVFISYSHDSDAHRQWVAALAQRLRKDGIDVRLDDFENGTPKQGWPRWMQDQLEVADFVLVVCTETYYRRFRGHEAPTLGKGVDFEGLLITQALYDVRSNTHKFVPVLAAKGDQKFIPEPLRPWSFYPLVDEAGYQALLDFLFDRAGVEPIPVGQPNLRPRRTVEPLTFGAQPAVPDDQKISPSRLPSGPATLFGRETELAKLDAAWRDPHVKVVTLVAWGGVGKTSLVSTWMAGLAERSFDGADYFDWSFYSQGTRDHATASADPFIDAALRFFGDEATADSTKGPWDKGARLAELVGRRRTLLVLDGLEPLQHGSTSPLAGELKDPAIKALLRGLAGRNAGLCVVTTRLPLPDLDHFRTRAAPEWKLDRLPAPAGVALLVSLEVQGPRAALDRLVKDVKGHALTLQLIGSYLRDAHQGDVRRRNLFRLEEASEQEGGHAFAVIAAYQRFFEAAGERGHRQLAVLRLLGLFDRPAPGELLSSLREPPVLPGLTEPLVGLGEGSWRTILSHLARAGLVEDQEGAVDTHPLIREYFGQQLRQHQPAAWRAAHGRIFDHLAQRTEHQPATLAGLQPLYQAVYHGCQAGRHEEACFKVYNDRISRGAEAFVVHKLGAFGADLGAVACFFEMPWRRVDPSLAEPAQAWLLNQAAFRLRALGRLREAVEPMRAGLEKYVLAENWPHAARAASNLSELELSLGEVRAAMADAEQSVSFADRSGNAIRRLVSRTALADAQHQAGDPEKALVLFREAERQQAEEQPSYPLLYSLRGFQFCDLLLASAELAAANGRGQRAPAVEQACAEVERRAQQTIAWVLQQGSLLDVALDHLSLGRARLYRAIVGERSAPGAGARAELEQAVAGLRAAGTIHHVPRGLLTRAWLRQVEGDLEGARADLDEAGEIAERGAMKLHLADVALYRARLFDERAALAEAKRLVGECGYGRRRAEIALLEERIGSA